MKSIYRFDSLGKSNKFLFEAFFILVILVTFVFKGLAQENPIPLGAVVGPSPNAQSLAVYGDAPVSTYTGIPGIGIPLSSMSSRDLTIPISLSYHAGGIKVQQEASSVGLGWTLNAGGSITQLIRGNDDLTSIGYGQGSGSTNFPDFVQASAEGMVGNSMSLFSIGGAGDFCSTCGETNTEGGLYCSTAFSPQNANFPFYKLNGIWADFQEYAGQASANSSDWEPDVFNFNFAGKSGKFLFDENGIPIVMDKDNIDFQKGDITGVTSNADGFTAILDNGFQYYFGKKEEVKVKNSTNVTSRTFYLSHIVSPMGERAFFQYTASSTVDKIWGLSESEYIAGPSWYTNQGKQETFTESEYNPQHLTSISFFKSSKMITFSLENREDILGEKKVRSIHFLGETGGQLKEFVFDYSYFESNPIYGDYTNGGCSIDQISKRLKLNSLVERNGSESLPPYQFSYNEDIQLPCKTAYAQDYWGYFNGATHNTQLIPDFRSYFPLTQVNSTMFSYTGADRDPNPNFMKAGILEKITYPSGGFAEYEFETNEYSNFGSLPYLNNKKFVGLSPYRADDVNDNNADDPIVQFEVPFNTSVTFTIDISCPFSTQCGLYNPDQPQLNPFVALYNNYPSSVNLIERWPHNQTQAMGDEAPFEVTLYLEAGTYAIQAFYPDEMPGLNQNGFDGGVSVQADIPIFEEVSKKYAGGLRVAKTRVSEGSNDIIKKYNYSFDAFGEEISYGRLMSPSTFHRYTKRPYQISNGGTSQILEPMTAIRVSNSAFLSESLSAQGSSLGYSKVIISHGENGENGQSELEYHNVEDNFSVLGGRPASLPTLGNNMNGYLKKQTDFNDQGDPVRVVDNIYESLEEQTIKGVMQDRESSSPNTSCFHVMLYWYTEKAERIELVESKETKLGLTTVTNYTYTDKHRSPISTTTYLANAPSQATTTTYKYPYDLLNETGSWEHTAIQRLIDKNMITIPLETINSGMVSSGSKVKFKCFNTSFDPQMPLPFEIYSKEQSGFVLRKSNDTYDSEGRIKLYHTRSHPSQVEMFYVDELLDYETYEGFLVDYDYWENSQNIKSITGIDKQSQHYRYDDLQRLDKVSQFGASNALKSETTMVYQIGSGNNSITSTTTYADGTSAQESLKTYDNLGRYIQTNINGVLKDKVTYDNQGRIIAKTYLPGSDMSMAYDNSPLNIMESETYPDGSMITYQYQGNSQGMMKVSTTDENGNTSHSYLDLLQRQVTQEDALGNTTEFEYNPFGNIGVVTPPAGGAYTYTYDNLNRLISKVIPSGGTKQFKYNSKDQLVLSTDSNLQEENQWIGTKYDIYGRPTQTGFVNGMPSDLENLTINTSLTETFYDQYSNISGFPGPSCSETPLVANGKVVGTKVKILDSNDWIYTSNCYDEFGRSIVTSSSNHLGGNDIVTSTLNNADLPTSIERLHSTSNGNQTITEGFTYDNFFRTQAHTHSVAGVGSANLSFSQYNNADQLYLKTIGGELQNIDYTYNSRGWLTHINDVDEVEDGFITQVCDPEELPCIPILDYTIKVPFQTEGSSCGLEIYGIQFSLRDTNGINNFYTADLNYPYEQYTSDLLQLETDLKDWLTSEGIAYDDVIFSLEFDAQDGIHPSQYTSGMLDPSYLKIHIVQSEIPFLSVQTRDADYYFEQIDTTTQVTGETICSLCESRGYDCDRCPFTELPDSCDICTDLQKDCSACQPQLDICTQCVNLGYDDCRTCPIATKMIIPKNIRIDYRLEEFISLTETHVRLVKVTETSERVQHDGSVHNVTSSRMALIGNGTGVATKYNPFHVLNIPISNQVIDQTSYNTVMSNIKQIIINQLQTKNITTATRLNTIAEGILLSVSKDWHNTTNNGPLDPQYSATNPDLFSMQLTYGDAHDMINSTPQQNGNISGMIWQAADQGTQSYSFTYDAINRITQGHHQNILEGGGYSEDNKFGINVSYDEVGNIESLYREGMISVCNPETQAPTFQFGSMDNLTYTYGTGNQANRLMSIAEGGDVDHGYKGEGGIYEYDDNGNVTFDGNKDINIEYNFLNLPKLITFNATGSTIQFTYDAAGIKLSKEVSGTDSEGESVNYKQDYVGGIEYKDNQLEAIYHAEGRIAFEENEAPRYEYYLKDHLGNTRVVFSDINGDGHIQPYSFGAGTPVDNDGNPIYNGPDEVLQVSNYYPFGMQFEGPWSKREATPENKYLYNGSQNYAGSKPVSGSDARLGMEYVNDFDLNLNLARYRTYDPAIGRWYQIDPKSEDFYPLTPYNNNENNPISNADPNGDCPWCLRVIIGGAVGAAGDYAWQVGGNIVDGKGWSSLTDVDGNEIKMAAATGALGVSMANKLLKGAKAADKANDVKKKVDKAKNLSKSEQKSIKSLEKQIEKHQKKLDDYKANPDKFDNKGHLKNAPNEKVKKKIIEGREKHLNKEIKTFKENIDKIKKGKGKQ